MMLANVFTKGLRDRAGGVTVGVVATVLLLAFGIVVYQDVDVSFYYEELPAAILELMGIPANGGVAGLVFASMYNLIGALTMASLAISIGASSVAGEEEAGTMGLLLGNPKSRTQVYLSKAGALTLLMGLGCLVLWAGGLAAAAAFDMDLAGLELGALCFHIFVNSNFYGFLAMAIGGWSGSRSAASGASVAVMLVGYLAGSILPLVESLDWLARLFPWYYFSNGQPIINGVDWAGLSVLFGLSVVAFAMGLVGVNRRDLRERGVSVKLIDRLRAHPMTRKMAEKVAGSARVSGIWAKTVSDHQGALVVTAIIMFYMGILIGPLYSLIPDDFVDFVATFPDVLIAMIGGADMATPEGFYQGEVFSLVGPIAFVVLTASIGSKALAGEEEKRTMGLLLSNPIGRSRVITEKVLAMVLFAFALGFVTFLATWAGSLLGGLGVAAGSFAAISFQLVLLSLVFGAVALVLSAATGRTRIASYGTTAIAVVAYFVNAFLPISERFAGWARLSPFHYYLAGDPLVNGVDWAHVLVLVGLFGVILAASYPLFQGRDLRG